MRLAAVVSGGLTHSGRARLTEDRRPGGVKVKRPRTEVYGERPLESAQLRSRAHKTGVRPLQLLPESLRAWATLLACETRPTSLRVVPIANSSVRFFSRTPLEAVFPGSG